MFSLMAPIPLALRFTHPFLFSSSSSLSREHSLKKSPPKNSRGEDRIQEWKWDKRFEGGRKADERIGERNFLLPAARDILRGPSSSLSHPSGFLPFSPSHLLFPTHSRYKAATPSRMLKLTFYTTARLVVLEIIMPALSATQPPR